MSNKRRKFIKNTALGAMAIPAASLLQSCSGDAGEATDKEVGEQSARPEQSAGNPVVISTWKFGLKANERAWTLLSDNGGSLDAVEKGVMVVEADPEERSVGYGGRPDRDGRVTLDACIMDALANIGSVAALEYIKHPISVARAVMEKTPHVMLVGDGALQFALQQGFEKENLLTEASKQEWREWLRDGDYIPIVNIENHDTIGMLALDARGDLAGACTTSGIAFKMHGRVGDSPIIGAGLYVDNEVGAATATGHGEEVIRVTGSFLVVELMRQGYSPRQACERAVTRIYEKFKRRKVDIKDTQIGFIALDRRGRYGGFCLREGFNFAVKSGSEERLVDAAHLL